MLVKTGKNLKKVMLVTKTTQEVLYNYRKIMGNLPFSTIIFLTYIYKEEPENLRM